MKTALLSLAAVYCVYTGENISGINKLCHYDCAGSAYTITVGLADLCPVGVNA